MTLETHKPKIPVYERWFGTWQISVNRRGFSADDLRQAYDDQAPMWTGKLMKLGFLEAYRKVMAEFTEGDDLVGGTPFRVLDCGVGTGALSAAFAHGVAQPFDLSAVDISPSMLSEARRNLSDLNLRFDGQIADMHSLPFETDSFDRVICAHTVEHLGSPKAGDRRNVPRAPAGRQAASGGNAQIGAWCLHSPQVAHAASGPGGGQDMAGTVRPEGP